MTTGTTSFHYPARYQSPNQLQIKSGCHYYQFRLHEARAVLNASWPKAFDCLLLISEVHSSLYPGNTIRSLHTVKTLKRNQPCQIGIRKNLTDWLPARATDSCTITIKYIGIRSSPVKNFLLHMEKSGLASMVTALEPEWKAALKVSDIVGKTVSYLLKEGTSQELFSVMQQFNINDLRTGYYVALGCSHDLEISGPLYLNSQQKLLSGRNPKLVENVSYSILQVAALTRMGEDIMRQEAWWQLLKITKDEIFHEVDLLYDRTPDKVLELKRKWYDALKQARKMVYQDRGYLLEEVNDIFKSLSYKVHCKLRPAKTLQSFSSESIVSYWQHLLDVSTVEELQQCATDYQYELQWSEEQRKLEKS